MVWFFGILSGALLKHDEFKQLFGSNFLFPTYDMIEETIVKRKESFAFDHRRREAIWVDYIYLT